MLYHEQHFALRKNILHRPLEGKPVTCSVKRYRAEEVEEALENHLLRVINQAGYLKGIEKAVSESILANKSTLVMQKETSARALEQIDKDIKGLVRLQMQTENLELQKLYSSQLIELQDQRKLELNTLERCRNELSDLVDPKKFVVNLQEGLSRLQMAWDKANPKMRKALLKVVIEKLVFNKGEAQIFYRQIDIRSGDDIDFSKNINKSQNVLVDMSQRRNARKIGVRHPPLISDSGKESFENLLSCEPAHNAKVVGWYIGKIGCGNRI